MGESCSLVAHVKNSKGEVVESRLFNDLLHYTSNDRDITKQYYGVGTNQEFLNKVRDKADFDENGEITFNSLRKLSKLDIKEEKLIETLNEDIGAGTYDYEKAITKVQNFNRGSQFSKDYMAMITPEKGKYKLSIVPRTSYNESTLEKTIAKRTLRDRLMYHLNKAGVSVKFLEEDDKIDGVYSTENVEKAADGMYNLIRVANGEKLTETLAEESGHFAIGALGESPLVKRLTDLLEEDVQRKILGDNFDSKAFGSSRRREVAGVLVGKALMNEVDNKSAWNKLANRIANLAKRIFATIKGDEVLKDILNAENIARNIARNFMSSEFEGNIDNALSIRETLYSADLNINTETYRKVINGLSNTADILKSISEDVLYLKVRNIRLIAGSDRLTSINMNPNNALSNGLALDGIAEALSIILDMCGPGKEINNLLESVDFLNTSDFLNNIAENGRKLRQVHTFVMNSINLQKEVYEALDKLSGKDTLEGNVTNIQILDKSGNITSINLEQLVRDLGDINDKLLSDLTTKEKQFFLKFCEYSLGSKYVYRASRVIWNLRIEKVDPKKDDDHRFKLFGRTLGTKVKDPKDKYRFTAVKKGERLDLSAALTHLESDIDIFSRFIGSMANNPDIIGQIVAKVTDKATMEANNATNNVQDELRILEKEFKDYKGIKKEDLFEVDSESNLTGNYISQYKWGEWEKNWEDFKNKEKEEFKKNNPNLDNLSEFEKAARWESYFRSKAKDWHKINSRWDNSIGRYIPNYTVYNNSSEFNKLMSKTNSKGEKFEVWYNKFMDIKYKLDGMLPDGSTSPVRAPQFKGRFTNIIRNSTDGILGATGGALRSKLRDTFCESSEDTDFGSDQTYNSEEEEMFANSLAHEKEKIQRIPLYGINKLKDMTELSTDIFRSTLAYASMASTYYAMDNIVHTIEVGKNVLKRRSVGDNTKEADRDNHSRAYTRYIKYLDKQVYGISSTKHKIFKGIVIEKVLSTLSSLAGKYFLGGNVVGGAVNTMTGFNEIFKEAIAAEEFSLKDFTIANELYFKYLPHNLFGIGKEFKDDKLSLIIRYFDVLGDNKEKQRYWNTNKGRRLFNIFGRSLMAPYKTGDHYMQSIAYLAMLNKIKVYDEDGHRKALINAYTVTKDKGIRTLELPGIFFKSKNGQKEYNIIQSIIDKIESSASDPLKNAIILSSEEQEYIDRKGYNLADTENTLKSLRDDSKNLTWSKDDESDLANKCREINDRLHGIYNNQDKTALHQHWFGNMFLAMKGYALGMLERRFAPGHYSTRLGHEVEGSLQTLGKVLLSNNMNVWTKMLSILAPINFLGLPIGKAAKKAMYKAGFSKNQYANMRRNWGDMLLIGLLWVLRALTAKGDGDDDDEEEDVNIGIVYYFASRLYNEQAAFNLIPNMMVEKNTLLDLTPAGFAAVGDIFTLGKEFAGIPFADEENPDYFYQSEKEDKYEEGTPKAYVHFVRMFPYLRSVYIFNHPYEAYESYEYGRNIKSR